MSNETHISREELEFFALGALPDAEAAVVRQHMTSCAACTRLLAEARGHVALLAFSVEQEVPAPVVKAKLFARIATERGSEKGAGARGMKQRKASWWNWILVPATAILALLSFGLWRQNNALFAELRDAQRNAASLEQERMHVQKLVNTLAAPETITVKLSGTPDAVGASGVVRFNSRTGLMVYMTQLPALPAEKAYQMWLVPATGAPISGGVFVPAPNGKPQVLSAEVPPDTEPKAFAVTVEPAGGVPQATGPKVLLGASSIP